MSIRNSIEILRTNESEEPHPSTIGFVRILQEMVIDNPIPGDSGESALSAALGRLYKELDAEASRLIIQAVRKPDTHGGSERNQAAVMFCLGSVAVVPYYGAGQLPYHGVLILGRDLDEVAIAPYDDGSYVVTEVT
jgi:hypothetical protein